MFGEDIDPGQGRDLIIISGAVGAADALLCRRDFNSICWVRLPSKTTQHVVFVDKRNSQVLPVGINGKRP